MNRIILALDTTNIEEAINITKRIKDKIYTVKLGLEFFNAHGKNGVKEFNKIGINNLMLDLKLKDIPETVYKAIKALDDIKFSYLTIHGQGGRELVESAKKAASEIKSKPKIMMVTILTSLSDSDLKDIGSDSTVIEQVKKLAKIAEEMKKHGGYIPGIRPGKKTAEYVNLVLSRLTFGGATYLAAVCLFPYILFDLFDIPFYFGGTALLIVVGVGLDLVRQIEAFLLNQNYDGFMKKTKRRQLKSSALRI